MKIFVGSDHRGFGLKASLIQFLQELGHEVEDKGAYEYNESDDYPDFIIPVAREVSMRPNDVRGIVFGASGQGEAMTANKFPQVRCAVYYGETELVSKSGEDPKNVVQYSRIDNNSNMLSLGALFLTEEQIQNAVRVWLETPFSNAERHQRRIAKMDHIH